MSIEQKKIEFGCQQCWPFFEEAAKAARHQLPCKVRLIDEPHFIVNIRVCSDCAQQFISIFTETVDWVGGNDPQYWMLMPITEDEAIALTTEGCNLKEQTLNALGEGRKSLHSSYPSYSSSPHVFWTTGIFVDRHD